MIDLGIGGRKLHMRPRSHVAISFAEKCGGHPYPNTAALPYIRKSAHYSEDPQCTHAKLQLTTGGREPKAHEPGAASQASTHISIDQYCRHETER